jgi:hypothetical protein
VYRGSTQGRSSFFYASSADLQDRAMELGRGNAVEVEPFSCTLELANAFQPPPDAVAELRSASLAGFTVHVEGILPSKLAAALQAMSSDRQLKLTGASRPFQLALVHDAAAQSVDFYRPEALPDPAKPQSDQPMPIRRLPLGGTPEQQITQTDAIVKNILYLSSMHRLMNLQFREHDLEIELFPCRRVGSELRSLDNRPEVNGLPQLRDGDTFAIRLKNRFKVPVQVTVFSLGSDGRVRIIEPAPSEETRKVEAGQEVLLGDNALFIAHARDRQAIQRDGHDRARLKIIATSDNVDFWPLMVDPAAGRASLPARDGVRGGTTALYELMRDALHGGQTRAEIAREVPSEVWGTGSVVFDVVPVTAPSTAPSVVPR